MKKFIVVLLLVLFVPMFAHAVKVKLPSGQEVSLDGMNQIERNALMDYLSKSSNNVALPSSPNELAEWRTQITGTIRDIAQDLNVAVNDFVKTPVGLGMSALIIYKVAGKDMLKKAWSFLIIPYWFVMTSILLGVFVYLFKPVSTYEREVAEGGKITRDHLKRDTRFPFDSDDARNTTMFIMGLLFVANTIASLVILFS